MASTMETWAKLTGGYGVLKGGISGFNNQMKKLGPEAQMERIQKKEQKKQDKENAKIKKEAADEYVREHKDIKKRLQSGALTTQKAQEAHKKAVEDHTAKIQAMPTPAAKLPLVAGQDNKTGGPDVAGQDISGVDSVAIVTAIENQTVEIITELGTDSPQLEPAGSPTMAEPPKVSEPVSTDVAVLEEVKETNVLLSPMNSALAELVDMGRDDLAFDARDRKSTRLNSSHT